MRLLDVHTRTIKEFLVDSDIKGYAILSHTWGREEVTFEDFQSLPKDVLEAKEGYAKIDGCCRQAEADGYDWVWIDTCCIDKRSSAELLEAINSMFRWYKSSDVCYAYLADVHAHEDRALLHDNLARARWFTRGWTLQELIAPANMEFYARGWENLGNKDDLSAILMAITGIPIAYLSFYDPPNTASVAMRMSWAARRSTSRVEDIAYCLLGLFDINMSLLYGEGEKAFQRLQEEIMKANPTDHTLFAWGRLVRLPNNQVTNGRQLQGLEPIPGDATKLARPLRGLFARSPRDFQGSAGFSPWKRAGAFYIPTASRNTGLLYPTVTGTGITLELPVLPNVTPCVFHWPLIEITQLRSLVLAILLCRDENDKAAGTTLVVLPLYGWGDAQFGRTDELVSFTNIYFSHDLVKMRRCLKVEPQASSFYVLGPRDCILCRWGDTALYQKSLTLYSPDAIYVAEEGVINVPQSAHVGKLWTLNCRLTKSVTKFGFGLIFVCAEPQEEGRGYSDLSVSLVPLVADTEAEDTVTTNGITWINERCTRLWKFESKFSRSMAYEGSRWRFDVAPFPLVEVYITRKNLYLHYVINVVNVTISDRPLERGPSTTARPRM